MAQADGPEALENALAAGLRGLRAEALGQVRPGREEPKEPSERASLSKPESGDPR